MAKANGKLIVVLILIFGYLMHLNNAARSVNGIQSLYSDPMLITQGNIFYVVFFALLTGYVIARLLGKK